MPQLTPEMKAVLDKRRRFNAEHATKKSPWITKASGNYQPPTDNDSNLDGMIVVSYESVGPRVKPWRAVAEDRLDWIPWDALPVHPGDEPKTPNPGDFFEHKTHRVSRRMFVGMDGGCAVVVNRYGRRDYLKVDDLLDQWRHLPDSDDWPEEDLPETVVGKSSPEPAKSKYVPTMLPPPSSVVPNCRCWIDPETIQNARDELRDQAKRREGVLGVRANGDGPDVYHTSVFLTRDETINVREVKPGDPHPVTVQRVVEQMEAATESNWYGIVSTERVREWINQLRGKK